MDFVILIKKTETISRIPATGNYMLSNDITDLSVAADSGLWIITLSFRS